MPLVRLFSAWGVVVSHPILPPRCPWTCLNCGALFDCVARSGATGNSSPLANRVALDGRLLLFRETAPRSIGRARRLQLRSQVSPIAEEFGPFTSESGEIPHAPPGNEIAPELPDGALALHPRRIPKALACAVEYSGDQVINGRLLPPNVPVQTPNMHRARAVKNCLRAIRSPQPLSPALLRRPTVICSMRCDSLWRAGQRIGI